MLFLAIIGAGARFHGSNPGHTTFELTYNFKVSEVKFIIVELGLLENMLLVVDEMGLPRSNVLTFDGDLRSVKYGCRPWTDLLLHGEADWITFDNEAKAKNTIAALLTTSGTTGLPKSAVISHYAFVSQGVMLQAFEDKPYEVDLIPL
jgi:long-subunit acyl-CoA synthetase (AMP-forming)